MERENALKKWAMKHIRDNYDDFERLMGAKLNEVKTLISVGGGASGSVAPSVTDSKVQEWIQFHEPKINYMQKSIQQMEAELQEKVSFAMVQSMIAEANGSVSGAKDRQAFETF